MSSQVLALCGGVGGAKLALGLYHLLGPGRLTVVVNTADDFDHHGLHVSPDVDTVLYTLGGVADRERGWGRADESWNFMTALTEIGGETWFQLGDRDLAMHVIRSEWLRAGRTLTSFVEHAAQALRIAARILPMTDARVRTIVATDQGELPFQRYFVEQRCVPVVRALHFEGAARARPAAAFLRTLTASDLRAVVICPSNPYLSIDPILALPGVRDALAGASAPVVAVSPLIGGQAIKGPTAKIMGELGIRQGISSIAAHYLGLIDGLVVDDADAHDTGGLGVPALTAPTLMRDLADRTRLAAAVLDFADTLTGSRIQPVDVRAPLGMGWS